MTKRGFGVAAAIPSTLVAPLATAAEEAGYATFWVNDTPGADGLAALRLAADATSKIRLGVGVIPLDRRGSDDIAAGVRRSGIPVDRLVLGVGAGGVHKGSLELVRKGIVKLRETAGCRIAVGALGTKMIGLAGEVADGVILNWLTPGWVTKTTEGLRTEQGGTTVELIGYVRTSLTDAKAALEAESDRYASFPQYARHFERMGVSAFNTCVFGDDREVNAGLSEFAGVLDETVVRAVTAVQTLDAYLAVLRAGSLD